MPKSRRSKDSKTRARRRSAALVHDRRDLLVYITGLEKRLADLTQALIFLIKAEGSNLVPGRYSLIVRQNEEADPKPHDALSIETDEGKVTFLVEDTRIKDLGLKEQIQAFQQEMVGARPVNP